MSYILQVEARERGICESTVPTMAQLSEVVIAKVAGRPKAKRNVRERELAQA